MHALWDVFWTDTKAAMIFIAPTILLSLPASLLGALYGRKHSVLSWSRLLYIAFWGAVIGTGLTVGSSMIVQFFLSAEGLPLARRALTDPGMLPMTLISLILAFLVACGLARRAQTLDDRSRRRYTLRQLLLVQLIVGLLLSWWVITRRDELAQRRVDLDWQAREQAANQIFAHYGWYVKTWPDNRSIALWAPGSAPQAITDAALDLVAQHDEVIELHLRSEAVSDDGLKRLAAAKNLHTVVIESSQITDAGIQYLSRMPRLQYLHINSPRITLEGLKKIPHSNSLETVIAGGITLTRDEHLELLEAQPDIGWGVPWKE